MRKEQAILIAVKLREIADILDAPVPQKASKKEPDNYTPEYAIALLSNLATANNKEKIKEVKAIITKHGINKLPELKTAKKTVIKAIIKDAEVLNNGSK